MSYFEKLYNEISSKQERLAEHKFSQLNQTDLEMLGKSVTNEEIKRVLFDMAPLKALGSDGYHVCFFQNQWDKIGYVICDWVKEVFSRKPIDQGFNNTLIVLISKIDHPEEIS